MIRAAVAPCMLACLLVGGIAGAGEALPDVRASWLDEDAGQVRLTMRHAGHMVALRVGARVDAARDAAGIDVNAATASSLQLHAETTDPNTLETARFGIRLLPGSPLRVETFPLPPPVVARSHKDRLHDCTAIEDGAGGFSVICRVAKWAGKLMTANLTHPDEDSGAIGSFRPASLVRLDLPLVEGGAQARLVGYLDGSTAVVVRAEASWAPGESGPMVALADATRAQPRAPRMFPDFDFTF